MNQDIISALADGELACDEMEHALNALKQKETQEQWHAYHLISDTLRSSDLALTPSSDFSRRLATRLEAEPVLSRMGGAELGGVKSDIRSSFWPNMFPDFSFRRFLIPGVAAAAAVGAVGVVTISQFPASMPGGAMSMAEKSWQDTRSNGKPDLLARIDSASEAMKTNTPTLLQAAVKHQPIEDLAVSSQDMDDYLIAHQNVSPSVQSSAQYVRHSIFVTDAEK